MGEVIQGRQSARGTSFLHWPFYYDYNWTVHKEVSETVRQNITKAFLKLSNDTEAGKRILNCKGHPGLLQQMQKIMETLKAARKAGLLK